MDRIVELVKELEPEMPPPSSAVRARQRDALLRAMAAAEDARLCPRRWRPRRRGWWVAIAGAAVVVVVAVVAVRRFSPSPRPRAFPSAVLTAITRALSTTAGDIEAVRSTERGSPLSAVSWTDVSTGACRTDTSLNGQPSLSISVEHGNAVPVDCGLRQWGTGRSEGVSCQPLTPHTIEHDVAAGHYTAAGHPTLDGHPPLKLTATVTTKGPHPVTRLTTLGVKARTYLPIQLADPGDRFRPSHRADRLCLAPDHLRQQSDIQPDGFGRLARGCPAIRMKPVRRVECWLTVRKGCPGGPQNRRSWVHRQPNRPGRPPDRRRHRRR